MSKPRISLKQALQVAAIFQKAKTAKLFNSQNGVDILSNLARLALPREAVSHVIDYVAQHSNNDASLRKHYAYQAGHNPPRARRTAMAARLPSVVEHPDDDNDCTYEGVDLILALHGPEIPYDEVDRVGGRRVRPVAFADAFKKLRIAPRADGGFWIKPYHAHAPGDRCCYAVNEPIDDETCELGYIGCTTHHKKEEDTWTHYFFVREYLRSGLVSLDELRPFMYGDGQSTEISHPEDLPESLLPDDVYVEDLTGDLHIIEGVTAVRVCNFCHPIHEVVDECGASQGVQIRFWTDTGWRTHTVLTKALESEGSALFQDLGDNGLRVNTGCREAFRRIVKSTGLPKATQYSRPGWHGERFVLPTGVAVDGSGAAPALVARGCVCSDTDAGGSFEAWQAGVAEQIWKGDTPQFAVAQLAGAAGAVTTLLDMDNPVIHYSGPSGTGKTTGQTIAAGLTANPAPGRGTLIELQDDVNDVLPKGRGTCASFDDPVKHIPVYKVERLMYRAMAAAPATVSSVMSLEQIVEKAGSSMADGIRRRVITVDTSKIAKIDPRRAERIKKAARANYGHVMPRFAAELIRQGYHVDKERLQTVIDEYVDSLPGIAPDDSEAYAAAQHIGVLYAVGGIMLDAGLVPANADGDTLLQGLWADWLARRNSTPAARGAADVLRALGDLENTPQLGQPGEGAWSADGVGYLLTDALEKIIPADTTSHAVVDWFKAKGLLIVGGKGVNKTWSRLPAPDGRDLRHYRIKLAA